jgi:hypothetical protein
MIADHSNNSRASSKSSQPGVANRFALYCGILEITEIASFFPRADRMRSSSSRLEIRARYR